MVVIATVGRRPPQSACGSLQLADAVEFDDGRAQDSDAIPPENRDDPYLQQEPLAPLLEVARGSSRSLVSGPCTGSPFSLSSQVSPTTARPSFQVGAAANHRSATYHDHWILFGH